MSAGTSRPSTDDWRQREKTLDAFEAAWKRSPSPKLEDFLPPNDKDCVSLLVELARVDLECRRKAGLPATAEDYFQRFPQLTAAGLTPSDLLDHAQDGAVASGNQSTAPALVTASWTTRSTPAPAEPLTAGMPPLSLDSNYEIQGELGRGGMGVVFKAWDRNLRRTVAIKMLLAAHKFSAEHQARFIKEAQIVAQFHHPNIVQIYEIGGHGGWPYFVMEFVDGPKLSRKITENPLEPRDAARLVSTVAKAVQIAHEKSVVHRDLKTANILLSNEGVPKVTDFGLAHHPDSDLTTTGAVMGTPSYMAPEQAQGHTNAIDARTDIYALGVILYELTTGRVPFRAPTITATLQLVVASDPIPLRRLQPGIPRDLETICLKCLEKEPARRYPTAQALAEDLERFLNGQPIRARPVRWPERLKKWVRREPRLAALLGMLALLLVGSLGLALLAWREANAGRVAESRRADAVKREKEQLEEELYFHRITVASQELAAGKIPWAAAALDQCPERLRQWEWFYLKERCAKKEPAVLRGHSGAISSVAASSDGALMASASADGTVRLWEMATARPKATLTGHKGSVNWVTFTPDKNELASAGEDGTVIVGDIAGKKKKLVFTEHRGPVSCVAVHPTQPWIASTTFGGKQAGEILVWDKNSGAIRHRLAGHASSVTSLTFSPEGATLASASHDRTVNLWDVATGQLRMRFREHTLPIAAASFSSDGRWIASAAGRIESDRPEEDEILVWDSTSGKVRHRFHGHAKRTVAVAFAPHGPRLATAGWDQTIRLWDINTGMQVLTLTGHTEAVMSLAFTPQGTLASGSLDRSIRLWEASPQ